MKNIFKQIIGLTLIVMMLIGINTYVLNAKTNNTTQISYNQDQQDTSSSDDQDQQDYSNDYSKPSLRQKQQEYLTINVKKTWQDTDITEMPENVTIDLKVDDNIINSIELNNDNDWAGSFEDIEKFDDQGNTIKYYLKENDLDGFITSINYEDVSGNVNTTKATITNKKNPYIKINVEKSWIDDNEDYRPDSIIVNLMNGEQLISYIELTIENEWKGSFDNIRKYDEQGNVINYSLEEIKVDDYLSEIGNIQTTEIENQYTVNITNKFQQSINIEVLKSWEDDNEDYRPEMVIVKLMNGNNEISTIRLTKENDWKASFENIPKYDDQGREISYSIKELEVENYTGSVGSIEATDIENQYVVNITNTIDKPDEEGFTNFKLTKKLAGDNTYDSSVIPTVFDFEFDVTIKDKDGNPITGSYYIGTDQWNSLTPAGKQSIIDGTSTRYEKIEFDENGTGRIKLINDYHRYRYIYYLPEGISVDVQEIEPDNGFIYMGQNKKYDIKNNEISIDVYNLERASIILKVPFKKIYNYPIERRMFSYRVYYDENCTNWAVEDSIRSESFDLSLSAQQQAFEYKEIIYGTTATQQEKQDVGFWWVNRNNETIVYCNNIYNEALSPEGIKYEDATDEQKSDSYFVYSGLKMYDSSFVEIPDDAKAIVFIMKNFPYYIKEMLPSGTRGNEYNNIHYDRHIEKVLLNAWGYAGSDMGESNGYITTDEDGIVFENKYEETYGGFELHKIDALYMTLHIPGVTLQIYNDSGQTITLKNGRVVEPDEMIEELVTDENGIAISSDFYPKYLDTVNYTKIRYRIEEPETPEGYMNNSKVVSRLTLYVTENNYGRHNIINFRTRGIVGIDKFHHGEESETFNFDLMLKDENDNPVNDSFYYIVYNLKENNYRMWSKDFPEPIHGSDAPYDKIEFIDGKANISYTTTKEKPNLYHTLVEIYDIPMGWKVQVKENRTGNWYDVVPKNAQRDIIVPQCFDTTFRYVNIKNSTNPQFTLEGKKILENDKLKNGQFSFELLDKNNNVIKTVQNNDDGTILFDDIIIQTSDISHDIIRYYDADEKTRQDNKVWRDIFDMENDDLYMISDEVPEYAVAYDYVARKDIYYKDATESQKRSIYYWLYDGYKYTDTQYREYPDSLYIAVFDDELEYTIREVVEDDDSIIYDTHIETVKVKVFAYADSEFEVTVEYDEDGIEFINTKEEEKEEEEEQEEQEEEQEEEKEEEQEEEKEEDKEEKEEEKKPHKKPVYTIPKTGI